LQHSYDKLLFILRLRFFFQEIPFKRHNPLCSLSCVLHVDFSSLLKYIFLRAYDFILGVLNTMINFSVSILLKNGIHLWLLKPFNKFSVCWYKIYNPKPLNSEVHVNYILYITCIFYILYVCVYIYIHI
jgi:hypothetical protein